MMRKLATSGSGLVVATPSAKRGVLNSQAVIVALSNLLLVDVDYSNLDSWKWKLHRQVW